MISYDFFKGDGSGRIAQDLLEMGHLEDTGHWQGQPDVPMTKTLELTNVMVQASAPVGAPYYVLRWQENTKPNLPWAENHFLERVSGEPLNPPPSHKEWPFAQKDNEDHTGEDQKFSHTYPERLWPNDAHLLNAYGNRSLPDAAGHGFGDLDDVVDLLKLYPNTRQAYIPIWFPHDTGAVHEERVPCTLGYHFMRRLDKLLLFYPIRSCDFLRHFSDDLYMAGRLGQWVTEKCGWDNDLTSVDITMFMVSLHVFDGDRQILRAKYKLGREAS